MNLTFLSPLPALAVAAAAVPALLILYFLRLRRRPVRISSTLLWEQATRDLQVNIPFRFIRPTWLLLLQLLILGLFLLALARPALNMGSGARDRVILMIDRSASMSARDGDPSGGSTRLDEARRRALRTLDELSRTASGSSFAVVEFAASPRIASGFTQDIGAARSAIGAIQPSDQPGDLGAALRLAGAMLTGEATEAARPEPGMVIL
ncbi:MAG: VWA domain-containing protein, partial [Phycisphaerales bacterium]